MEVATISKRRQFTEEYATHRTVIGLQLRYKVSVSVRGELSMCA